IPLLLWASGISGYWDRRISRYWWDRQSSRFSEISLLLESSGLWLRGPSEFLCLQGPSQISLLLGPTELWVHPSSRWCWRRNCCCGHREFSSLVDLLFAGGFVSLCLGGVVRRQAAQGRAAC
ncbi:hypothetical protein JG687_00015462, partial [Phytophthora cactorum]